MRGAIERQKTSSWSTSVPGFCHVNNHVFQCVGKSQSILIQVSDRNHVQPVQAEINNKTMNNNNDYKL